MMERAPTSEPTVFIVESDQYIAKALRLALELTLSVQTVIAEDPSNVLPLVLERRPGLVIVDVYTRRFNAFDVIAGLKNDPKARGIPVIAMGPRGSQMDLARAMDCVDTLSLPFRIAELMSKVQLHLDLQLKPSTIDRDAALTRKPWSHPASYR